MTVFPLISASLMAADFLHLADDVENVIKAGVDMLHIDVMDGHYVPNLMFSPTVVEALKKKAYAVPLDVHLMVSNPEAMVPLFLTAGADWLSFHPDTTPHAHRLIDTIKKTGCKAGIVLNPGRSPYEIESLLPFVDFILLMTVDPGFGGQVFIPQVLSKIALLHELSQKHTIPCPLIQLDGGITPTTAACAIKEGAHILVAGTSIFRNNKGEGGESSYHERIQQLKKTAP